MSVASLSQLAFLASILSPIAVGLVVAVAGIRMGFALALVAVVISALVMMLKRPLSDKS
jgi:dipeptide/tripeptide permease